MPVTGTLRRARYYLTFECQCSLVTSYHMMPAGPVGPTWLASAAAALGGTSTPGPPARPPQPALPPARGRRGLRPLPSVGVGGTGSSYVSNLNLNPGRVSPRPRESFCASVPAGCSTSELAAAAAEAARGSRGPGPGPEPPAGRARDVASVEVQLPRRRHPDSRGCYGREHD